jgi:hypothetical protein
MPCPWRCGAGRVEKPSASANESRTPTASHDRLFSSRSKGGMRRNCDPGMPALPLGSQRAQKIEQILLLGHGQAVEEANDGIRLRTAAGMVLNCLK